LVAILELDGCSAARYSQSMLRDWLRETLQQRGMAQAELARRLTEEVGRSIDRAAVNKMLNGKRGIDAEEALAIERILQTPAPREAAAKPADVFKPHPLPGADLVGVADLPVYAAAKGGDGHMIVTFDAIDYVKRPEPLRNVRGGYGLLITGVSMIPAYRPGDTALVHPHLPPARDTEVVLYHTPPDGEAEAMIKTLVGFNDREWTLEQYNPAQQFTEFQVEWPICHRVVGKYATR
jgi:phage repressor protein C with HTH and peptisase S24 domain